MKEMLKLYDFSQFQDLLSTADCFHPFIAHTEALDSCSLVSFVI